MDDQHAQRVGRALRSPYTGPHPDMVDALTLAALEETSVVVSWPVRYGKGTALAEVARRLDECRTDRTAHEYWSTVLHERVEQHRAALPTAPERAVCDGWGLVTIPSPNGPEHYSCHGCPSCRPLVPLAPAADPFARLPVVESDDDLEM